MCRLGVERHTSVGIHGYRGRRANPTYVGNWDCTTVILRCGREDLDTPNWILDWELYHLALLWGIWTDTIYLDWGRSGGSSSWRWQTLAHWVDWGIEEGKVQAYKDTMHNLDKIDVTLALDLGA